ncbi:hypothetical protein [Thermoactinomyces mirandus]|uniref:Uncharacterized protein n=1 Tax=Thermoactinomyces mirandus TaxID=2756294 RepID=A0A7W1XQU0_9BACL|nr:hypothetical protein [Thermoactinomyces mirandus]MBA4601593.1 hypothetical protein [Thermoactinomyces mirandus]
MERAVKKLWRKQMTRKLVDPVLDEQYVIRFEPSKVFFVSRKNDTEQQAVYLEMDQVVYQLHPLYERFRGSTDSYLENVFQTNRIWNFFDVSYGLDIKVNKGPGQEKGWEVWMGEDLGFATAHQWEAREYVKGLLSDEACWFEKVAKRELDLVL